MTRIGIGCVAAAALLSAALAPAAGAATPADTLVIAKNIDDIISLDPAEVFELSGGEMINQLYDRIMAYEAEDTTKLVAGVAESYSVSDDGRTITLEDPARPRPSTPATRCAPRTWPSPCSA